MTTENAVKKYTESHEWVSVEGNQGTVGITEHAQSELGDIVFVELPEVGAQVAAGAEVVVLESTKAAADVYAPVAGRVTAVNEALGNHPDQVNKSAEAEGWLFKMELSDPSELDGLMDETSYQGMIG